MFIILNWEANDVVEFVNSKRIGKWSDLSLTRVETYKTLQISN